MSDPSPQQRADYIVRRLEQFIRDGKSERAAGKGMSFKTWQALARAELANSFAEQERRHLQQRRDFTTKRLILTAASALVTIGFWGAVVAVDKSYGRIAAKIIFGAGIVLLLAAGEMSFRRLQRRIQAENRRQRFQRIEDFDQALKRMENQLWRKRKRAEEAKEAAEPPPFS